MAGRIQPIVYKPTSPTKYLDAFSQRQLTLQDKAEQQRQKLADQRRKQQKELGVSIAGDFANPTYQQGWDSFVSDRMKYLQGNPEDIEMVIGELDERKKALRGMDDMYVKKSVDIHTNPNNYWGVQDYFGKLYEPLPKDIDYNDLNTLRNYGMLPLSFAVEKQNLNKVASPIAADVIEMMYNNDPDKFDVTPRSYTDPTTGAESVQFQRTLKPQFVDEAIGVIKSRLPNNARLSSAFEFEGNANTEREFYKSLMGLSPLKSRGTRRQEEEKKGFRRTSRGAENEAFSFVLGQAQEGKDVKFQTRPTIQFLSVEKTKPTVDVPLQEYFYKGKSIKGRAKGFEKVGDAIFAIVPTIIETTDDRTGVTKKEQIDARVELDPNYNMPIATNAYKVTEEQLLSMFEVKTGQADVSRGRGSLIEGYSNEDVIDAAKQSGMTVEAYVTRFNESRK